MTYMLKAEINFKALIGEKIRKRRIEQGFKNQSELAAKVGVDQSHVSKWETGTHAPEGHLKNALAVALSVDPSFFDTVETSHAEVRSQIKAQLDATPKSEKQMADFVYEILEENKELKVSLAELKKDANQNMLNLPKNHRDALTELANKIAEGIVDINSLPEDRVQSATIVELKKLSDTLTKPIFFKYLLQMLQTEPFEVLSTLQLTGKNLQKGKDPVQPSKKNDSKSGRKADLVHHDRHSIRKAR